MLLQCYNEKYKYRTYFYLKLTYSNFARSMEHVYQNKSPRVFQFPSSHLGPHFLNCEHDLL